MSAGDPVQFESVYFVQHALTYKDEVALRRQAERKLTKTEQSPSRWLLVKQLASLVMASVNIITSLSTVTAALQIILLTLVYFSIEDGPVVKTRSVVLARLVVVRAARRGWVHP